MEIHYASEISGMSVKEALRKLKKSGLDSLTGTSAEILSDRVRNIICPEKISAQQWIDIIKTAHKTGISTNATIMYGHVETIEERLDHVFTIREIQKETGGFNLLCGPDENGQDTSSERSPSSPQIQSPLARCGKRARQPWDHAAGCR